MSNFDANDYDDEPLDDGATANDTKAIRALRQQVKELNDLNATLKEQAEKGAQAARENALYQANLGTLNDDQREAILTTVKEHTPDAYKAKAAALGFIEPPAPNVAVEELAAQQQIANAHVGADPVDGNSAYETEMAAARNEREALAVMAKYGVQTA